MTVISFIVGILNYEENVDQSTMNEAVKSAVDEIHEHLRVQDEKIDKILEVLNNDR